jgi:hypothetical protein
MRDLYIAFHSGSSNLHSHSVPFTPMSLPEFVVVCVTDDTHFDWGEVESQCSLSYISFVTKDGDHFLIYLLAVCASFENCLLSSFIRLFSVLLIL